MASDFDVQLSAAVDDDLAFLAQQAPASAAQARNSHLAGPLGSGQGRRTRKRRRKSKEARPYSELTWEEKLALEEKERRRATELQLHEAPKIKRNDRGQIVDIPSIRAPYITSADLVAAHQNSSASAPAPQSYFVDGVSGAYGSAAGAAVSSNRGYGSSSSSSAISGRPDVVGAYPPAAPSVADDFAGLDDLEMEELAGGGSETDDAGSVNNLISWNNNSSSSIPASGSAMSVGSASNNEMFVGSRRPRSATLDSLGSIAEDEAALAAQPQSELISIIRRLKAENTRLRDRADAAEAELRLLRADKEQRDRQAAAQVRKHHHASSNGHVSSSSLSAAAHNEGHGGSSAKPWHKRHHGSGSKAGKRQQQAAGKGRHAGPTVDASSPTGASDAAAASIAGGPPPSFLSPAVTESDIFGGGRPA